MQGLCDSENIAFYMMLLKHIKMLLKLYFYIKYDIYFI